MDDIEGRILRLEPGDVLVVRSKYRLTTYQTERVREVVESVLAKVGRTNPVMVVEDDLDFQVIRTGDTHLAGFTTTDEWRNNLG